MKFFVEPEVEVTKFAMEDVITTSAVSGGGDGNTGSEIWDED